MSEPSGNLTLLHRARSYRDLLSYHMGQTRTFARHDYRLFEEITRVTAGYLDNGSNEQLRVLDIGCGQRYPNTLLFANRENSIAYGVDTDIVGPGIGKYLKMISRNGIERTLKSAAREVLFDTLYFRTLNRCAGRKLYKRKLRIMNIDAGKLPFEDDYFDLVVSNAVFEHIADIPSTLKEISRVSKPNAVYFILIHLYCSLSGGHNMRWAFPARFVPDDVPPWDHLRKNRFPTHIYLNKFRESDYREYFERYTEVLDWRDGPYEGEELLSSSIRHELSDYTREELLKRYVTVISRPRKAVL